MNTKKISISILAFALAATSAFAWSKKSENLGNLGRMYISVGGGINTSKMKAPATGETSSPTGAVGSFAINAPVFKPCVNAFKDIKWAGVDASVFFNYSYSGDYSLGGTSFDFSQYGVGAALTPYLNFETSLPVLKAIKPFGIAYAGYSWLDASYGGNNMSDNFFVYGVGGGVEFVILDNLSLTPQWIWHGNAESGMPCYQSVGAELSYWFTDQFCFSVFWDHNLGYDYSGASFNGDLKHGDIIGAKFKIGFLR